MKEKKYFYRVVNRRTFETILEHSSDSLNAIRKRFKKEVYNEYGVMFPTYYYECRIVKNFDLD